MEGNGKDRRGGESPPVVEASGITKTELQETPPDGPAPLTETDVMQFVMEFNALAAEFPGKLTRFGQVTLDRFNREALESRVAAGTWSQDWPAFQRALKAGRVTSSNVTMRKLLQGEVLDCVAGAQNCAESDAEGAGRHDGRPARKRRPESTPERPHANLSDFDLTLEIEKLEKYIARYEAQPDLPAAKIVLLTEARAKLDGVLTEREARKGEE